jgi:hypothetical protein
MYSLLALLCVLFAGQVLRLFGGDARWAWYRWAVLCLTILAGALTHHHFALLVGGTLAWCGVTQLRPHPRRVIGLFAATAIAYAALFAIHPFFRGTGYKHLTDARLPDTAGLESRVRQALEALAHAVVERRFGTGVPYWAVIALASLTPIVFALGLRAIRKLDSAARWGTWYLLIVGIGLTGAVLALYLIGVSPAHAMSYRYLAMSWPFLAIAAGAFLAAPRSGRSRMTWIAAACALTLVTGSAAAWMQWHRLEIDANAPAATELLRTADHFVVDNVGRGHWPRPLWRMRDDAQVFVAMPNDLLRRPMTWLADAPPGTVYVSPAQSAVGSREKVVASIARTRDVRFVAHLHGIGDVFVIGVPRETVKRAPTPPTGSPPRPAR